MQSTIPDIARLHHRIFEGFSPEEEVQFMALLQKLVHINNSKSRAPLGRRKASQACEPAKEKHLET